MDQMLHIGQRIRLDAVFILSGNLLNRLRGLIVIPFLVSWIGIESYGIYVQILVNVNLILPLCTLSMGMGFYRYTSQHQDASSRELSRDYTSVFTATLFLSLLGALVLYLTSPYISRYILNNKGLDCLRLSSFFLLNMSLYKVNSLYMQARKRFRLFSIYDIAFNVMPTLAVVAGVGLRNNLFAGLQAYLIVQTALGIGLFVIVLTTFHGRMSSPSIKTIKKFAEYSWALTFASIEGGILARIDRFIVGYYLGPSAIGLYNIIYSVCNFLDALSVPIRKLFSAYLPTRWENGDQLGVKYRIREALIYYLAIALWSLLVLTMITKPLLTLIDKDNFCSIAHFNLIVYVTGLGIIALGVSRFYYQLLKLEERNPYQLGILLIGVILNLILNIILLPTLGILGASIATLGGYGANLLLSSYLIDIEINRNYLFRLFTCLGIALAMLPVALMGDQDCFSILFWLLAITLAYILLLFGLRVIEYGQLRRILFGRD